MLAPELKQLRRGWEHASGDALGNILTLEGGWPDEDAFFATGLEEVDEMLARLATLCLERPLVYPRGRALDFGCGVGRLTRALAYHFDRVDGVDISQGMVDLATAYDHPRCAFYVSDEQLPFKDATFDFIYSNLTLQHIPHEWQRRYIAEFARVLRPGAPAVFHLPDGAYNWGEAAWMSMCGTPRAEVEGWIAEAGAEVVDAWLPAENNSWLGYFYTIRKWNVKQFDTSGGAQKWIAP